MRTRTYLTTPPGQEPSEAIGRAGDGSPAHPPGLEHERYVPALALPREPTVPSRARPFWLGTAVVLALALLAAGLVRAGASERAEDPALSDPARSGTDADADIPSLEPPAVAELPDR